MMSSPQLAGLPGPFFRGKRGLTSGTNETTLRLSRSACCLNTSNKVVGPQGPTVISGLGISSPLPLPPLKFLPHLLMFSSFRCHCRPETYCHEVGPSLGHSEEGNQQIPYDPV